MDSVMKKFIVLLLTLGLVSGTALAKDTQALKAKYRFDNLPTVDHFQNWNIDGWNVIDQRSLIVYTSPSRSYLLILDRRLPELPFAERIAVTSTGSTIYSRFDKVHVLDRVGINIPANIVRIYRLDGRQQRQFVEHQILHSGA